MIVVTGTPGSGKTAFARELSLLLRAKYLDVNAFARKAGLFSEYDARRRTWEVDSSRLAKALRKAVLGLKGDVVLDSHISHFFPSRYADICFVLRADLKTIYKRLKARHWPSHKVSENLEAEIFEVILTEARQLGHKVQVLDSSRRSAGSLARQAIKNIRLIRKNTGSGSLPN